MKKLCGVLDNAIRFIYNIKDWSVDLTAYYKKSHILPMELRVNYKVCLITHKALNGTAPPYIRDMLCLYVEEPSKQRLRAFSDNRLLLRTQLRDTKITRKMFVYHAPIIWNTLPYDLRHCNDTEKLRLNLKLSILVKYNRILIIRSKIVTELIECYIF